MDKNNGPKSNSSRKKRDQKKNINLSKSTQREETSEKCDNYYSMFSNKIFRGNKYAKFIKAISEDETICKCLECKNSITRALDKEILVNSVYTHIKSGSHHDNTPEGERKELAKLVKDLDEFKGKKKEEKSTKDED